MDNTGDIDYDIEFEEDKPKAIRNTLHEVEYKPPEPPEKKITKRKGPGRPRKKPMKEPIPKKGIATEPTDPDDIIELLYSMPIIFKKLIIFFKSLAASQIQIIFRHHEIIMYSVDHKCRSRMRVRIDATKLNHYYCHHTVDIGISCKDLELILNSVDKDYTSIILLLTVCNEQKSITMILENEMQIDEIHTIGLTGQYNHMENEEEFIDEDFTIKFKYPAKYFRKTISYIKTISNRISITQEEFNAPLEIGYRSINKKVRSRHTAKNAKNICLHSKLLSGDSFRVDVKVDYIKPISSSQIADEIWILVDENKNFMTKATIDNGTIEIKTLTEIIDNRPNEN